MKPAAFEYSRPSDWAEALRMLSDGARPAAGTQSLGPMLNFRLSQPARLADLRHLPGYAGVEVADGIVRIGAGTTHAAIEDGAVPGRLGTILAGIAGRIAYRAVRNRGTIGGSLAHADPAADWVATLPALGGTAIALGPRGERRIPLSGFVQGVFTTALADDELLRAIELPVLADGARWGHWKFCRKPPPVCWTGLGSRRAPCWPLWTCRRW
jgi:carbon-monoxide dehydrogenase medium subunit